MSVTVTQQKKQLRSEYQKKRAALTEVFRIRASQTICDHIQSWKTFQKSRTIFIYMPMNGEVDLLPLVDANPERQWVIPRIQPHSQMILYPYHPQKLILHKYGMLEPDPELPRISPDQVDLVLVPGLVYDRHGWRLGYGGGFYDTFLSGFPDLFTLGVTYKDFLLEDLPHMDHDVPVRALVTEEGILNFSTRMDD